MAFEIEGEENAQAQEAPSIRDELIAAMEGGSSSSSTPAPAATDTSAPKAPEAAAQDGRARDDAGKFSKAPAKAAPTNPEPKSPLAAGAEPQTPEAIRPPASWSAAAKADFANLPQHIQQEVMKREADVNAGLAQQQTRAERFNRLDAILSPRQERFKLAGIDETQAVQALFAAQDMLERDPANALRYLARQAGVDLRSLVQGAPQQQPQAQLPPVVQQMANEINTLKQTLAQQQSTAHQAAVSGLQNQIATFAADPSNLYFENVRGHMVALLKAGQATDLKDAYEKATWAHPETRPLLLRQQGEAGRAATEQAQRAKANQARQASGSVIGSPTPGSSPASAGSAPSLRAELERAFSASA